MVNKLPYLFLFILFVAIYLFRFYTVNHTLLEGANVRISGWISEDPLIFDNRQRLLVGGVKIYTDRFPEYHYGDRITAEGTLEKRETGWFLQKAKIEYQNTSSQKWLFRLRENILAIYKKILPEPHASLLAGIALGTKSSLNPHFFEQLRNSGTLHIIVASGTNISLFAGTMLNGLAILIGRRKAIIPALVGIWFYVLLVGWQPPIVRAGVMGSIAFSAQAFGREAIAWRALFASASILLILNPLWLFDVGFQLSFAATAGILGLMKHIHRFLALVPQIIKENLSTTLAAQIAVSPILFFSFGQISLIAPIVNTLVLPTVPLIMAGGILIGFLGFLSPTLAQILGWFLWIPLEYFVQIVRFFG